MRARVIFMAPLLCCVVSPAVAARPEIAAAETHVSLAAGFAHSAYGATGVSAREAGTTPEFAVSAALLLPATTPFDYYAAFDYRFSGGGLAAGGNATDQAVFNAAEARLGGGLALPGGAEIIPYFAIGYQGWNRVIGGGGGRGGESFYRSALAGAGAKLDLPVSDLLVVSLDAEFLALAGGSLAGSMRGVTLSAATRVTPQEHVELGLDDAAYGPLHIFAQAWATHLSVDDPQIRIGSTQSGVNLGIGYSFY
jgi:hypothetical protein